VTVPQVEIDMQSGEGRPLDGLRVLDLSSALGAYCTRILADFGADVLKVEPPTGDLMRTRPPFRRGVSGPETSLLFASYHANKRGVTLETMFGEALQILSELAAGADVVVISPTRRAPVVGFDWDDPSLSWAPPNAVVAAITPFGLTGPMREFRATPFVSFAYGGGMHHVGKPEGPPVSMPGQPLWDYAGLAGAIGIMAAVRARRSIGGQLLDISVHEAAAVMDFPIERYDAEGASGRDRTISIGYPPTGTWRCMDGELEISCHQEHHWTAFLRMLDYPDDLSAPSLADPLVRRAIFDGLIPVIDQLMAEREVLDLFERGQAEGLPCSPINTVTQFVNDVQTRSRGLFVATATTNLESVELPWKSFASAPPLLTLRRPAPSLGEHNIEVYVDQLGYSLCVLEAWKEAGLV
jgi:benzylsuccinate CoA-transferase BbsE subunit